MKTKNAIRSISSDRIEFTLPRSWEDLTEKQLRYVYFLRCSQFTNTQVLTYCLIRFLGIKVRRYTDAGWICSVRRGMRRKSFFLKNWEVQYFLKELSFLQDPAASVVNLPRIGRYIAVDRYLHDFAFSDYLQTENYYQGYLHTQKDELLKKLAMLLFRDSKGNRPKKMRLSQVELYSVFQWYFGLKNHFAGRFPYFFTRIDSSDDEEKPETPDMEAVMNSEIRALTGGDVTKEKEILVMDTWRALTELNEKARELKELEERK